MSLACGRKQENPGRTHTDTRSPGRSDRLVENKWSLCSILCVRWKSTGGNEPLRETGAAFFFVVLINWSMSACARCPLTDWKSGSQESQTEASFVLITIHTPHTPSTPPMDQRMLVGELESVLRPCALSALEKAILYHAAFWRLAIFRSEHQLQVKAYNLKAPMCCVLMFKYQKQQQIYVTKQSNTSWSQMKGHLFLNLYLFLHISIKQRLLPVYYSARSWSSIYKHCVCSTCALNVISFRKEHAHHLGNAHPKRRGALAIAETGCQI